GRGAGAGGGGPRVRAPPRPGGAGGAARGAAPPLPRLVQRRAGQRAVALEARPRLATDQTARGIAGREAAVLGGVQPAAGSDWERGSAGRERPVVAPQDGGLAALDPYPDPTLVN